MPSTDQLTTHLDRLAAFDSGPFPVLSLYVDARPDQHGRDSFDAFLRKELAERVRTYPVEGPERRSLEQDAEQVQAHLATLDASANGVALFSCAGAGFFQAVQLTAPLQGHRLFISNQPHLYPLARLADDYPRYAVLLADTHQARIFVIAAHAVETTESIDNPKTRGHKMGGWSQARYQRRVQNERAHHAREVAEVLLRVVQDESIDAVILAGDEVVLPLLRAEFTKELRERIVDTMALDIRTPLKRIIEATHELMQHKDADTDRERVEALLDAYRGNGLGAVGTEAVRTALEMGQVEELLVTGAPASIDAGSTNGAPGSAAQPTAPRTIEEQAADELIAKARQTAARITIIQDSSLLEAVGGVGALLRFRL